MPPVCLRTNLTLIERAELVSLMETQDLNLISHHMVPEAIYLQGAGAIDKLPGYSEGLFTVQDESSMLASHALAPKPGERVLDVCAGPGGKTTHLAELMKDSGEVWATDIHPHKLDLINKTAARLQLNCIKVQQGDARKLPANFKGAFNRVLVDAPCSGTGVLRRRSDLRWHKTPKELISLPKLQLEILTGASQAVAVGGALYIAHVAWSRKRIWTL